jgi:hypothetical protein
MGQLADAAKQWGQAMKAVRTAGTAQTRFVAERAVRTAFDSVLQAYIEWPVSQWDDADRTADAIFDGI